MSAATGDVTAVLQPKAAETRCHWDILIHEFPNVTLSVESKAHSVLQSFWRAIMSNSLFATITTLLRNVRASDGTPQTEVFLNVCRQIIPVIGRSILLLRSLNH